MRIITTDEFDANFAIKISARTKRIALIKLTAEDVVCTRMQFYTTLMRICEAVEIDLPLRAYSDSHMAFATGWDFISDDCADYIAE